jgi:LysM repeat protein
MIIAVNQQPDPEDAHMICRVGGIDIEMGGNEVDPEGVELDYHTNLTNPNSNSVMDTSTFNQWFYLPGSGGPTPPPVPANTVTVMPGDSLSSIADQLGVTLAALESANPQITDPSLIFPGQILTIPAAA